MSDDVNWRTEALTAQSDAMRFAARIEALEAERDRLLKLPVIADYVAVRDRAEALEAALREIDARVFVDYDDNVFVRETARAALSPTPER